MFTLYLCTHFSFFLASIRWRCQIYFTIWFFFIRFRLSLLAVGSCWSIKDQSTVFLHRHHSRLESSPDSQSHCLLVRRYVACVAGGIHRLVPTPFFWNTAPPSKLSRTHTIPPATQARRYATSWLDSTLFVVVSCGAMVRGDLGKSCKSRWRLLGDQTLVNTWGKSVFICVKSHRAVKGRGKKYEYQLIIIGQSYSMFWYTFFGISFLQFLRRTVVTRSLAIFSLLACVADIKAKKTSL